MLYLLYIIFVIYHINYISYQYLGTTSKSDIHWITTYQVISIVNIIIILNVISNNIHDHFQQHDIYHKFTISYNINKRVFLIIKSNKNTIQLCKVMTILNTATQRTLYRYRVYTQLLKSQRISKLSFLISETFIFYNNHT